MRRTHHAVERLPQECWTDPHARLTNDARKNISDFPIENQDFSKKTAFDTSHTLQVKGK